MDVEVRWEVDPKADEQAYARARRDVAVASALVASRLRASACLVLELERVLMRRTDNRLVLHRWCPEWEEPEVVAALPEPFNLTDFVVDRVERGVVEGTDLETTSREALDRFLAITIGGSWRSRHRLPPLGVPAQQDAALRGRAAGTVRPDADAWSFEWVGADGPRAARLWSKYDAQEVAWSLTSSLEDVVASIRESDGGQLFDVV